MVRRLTTWIASLVDERCLGTYFFFASLMIIFGAWAYFFIPETKGKTLEDMDQIFGVPHVETKNDGESSTHETQQVGGYGDDVKPEIEQYEFEGKTGSEQHRLANE